MLKKSTGFRQGGKLVQIADSENMGAIESCTAVGSPRPKGVITIEEKTLGKPAAFIQHMGPGIRSVDHQSMAYQLLRTELERVVVGNSFSFPKVRIRVVTYERHAKRRVSIRSGELSNGSPHLLGQKNAKSGGVCYRIKVAVI